MSIFYKSERIGQYGRKFNLLKLRTMKDGRHGGCPTASSDDDRLTGIGKVLRRFKIDELPTVINVIRGDIGLFGYRPDVPDEIYSLDSNIVNRLLKFKPGLISPCTVWNSNEDELLEGKENPHQFYLDNIKPTKYRLALWYHENRSIALDLKILLVTVLNLFRIRHEINCLPKWITKDNPIRQD